MITAAQLNIKIASEGAQQATADLRGVGNAVETTGQQSSTGAARIGAAGQMIRGVGMGLTAGVTAPILALGTSIVGMASDTNEALSAVQTVYGSAAQTVIDSSRNAATAVGMSQTEYLSATTQMAAYGTMMGLNQQQTAAFADQTVTMSSDLASFFNTSPADAMGAINAGLRGEFDGLERYGIVMNQATVEQYALTNGIWDGVGAMTTQQLEQARSGAIMDAYTSSTGSAHAAMGDFARTSGGLANQQRILKAQLKDVGAQFGQVLLPVAMKMVGAFSKVIGVLKDMSPRAKTLTVIVAGIAAAIGPALIGIGAAMGPLANGFRVARIALLAFTGPIGLIVAALVGLGIAYKTNFLGFGDAVREVGSKLKQAFGGIVDKVREVIQLFKTFSTVENPVRAALAALYTAFPKLRGVLAPIIHAVETLTNAFTYFRSAGANPIQAAVIALTQAFPGLRDVILGVYTIGLRLVDVARDLWDAFSALLRGDWAGVFEGLKAAFGDALGALGTAALVIGTLLLDAFHAIDWGAVGTALLDGLAGLAGLLGTAGAGLWGFLTNTFEAIDWTALGATAISLLGSALSATVDFALDVAADIGSALLDGLGSAKDWIVQKWPWTGPLFDAAANVVDGAVNLIANVTGEITSALGPAWASFKAMLGSIYGWLAGLFGGGGASSDDLGTDSLVMPEERTANVGLLASITGTITNALGAAWSSLKSLVGSVVGWLAGFLGGGAGSSYNASNYDTAYTGASDTTANMSIKGIVSGLFSAATDLPATLIDAVRGVSGWLADLMTNAIIPAVKATASMILDLLPENITITTPWGDLSTANFLGWVKEHAGMADADLSSDPAYQVTPPGVSVGKPEITGSWIGSMAQEKLGLRELVIQAVTGEFQSITPESFFSGTNALGATIRTAVNAGLGKIDFASSATEFLNRFKNSIREQIANSDLSKAVQGAIEAAGIAGGLIAAFASMVDGFLGSDTWYTDLRLGVITKLGDLSTAISGFTLDAPDVTGIISAFISVKDAIQGAIDTLTDWLGLTTGQSTVTTPGGDPNAGQYPDPTASNPEGWKTPFSQPPIIVDYGSGFIDQLKIVRSAFTETMTGITTDSDTAKTGVVAALTGMATDGLPQVTGLSALSAGEFVKLHAAGLLEATGLGVDVKARFADMQLGASGSAALTNTDVSTKLGTMKGTGVGHANALSAQTLSAFNNLKMGAIIAAGTTSTDVVTKLGTMASGGSAKATELMNNVKDRIRNSGAADTAYNVGYNVGSSLSSGLSAWLGTIQTVASDMIASVDRAMRKKAMISSPSRLFRQTGSYLGEGLVLGVSDWMDAAGQAGSQMIDTLQSSLSSLGGVGSVSDAIDAYAGAGPRGSGRGNYFANLGGAPWHESSGPELHTATTLTDTMKVIGDSLSAVLRDGEWSSDVLAHLPTQAISDLTRQIGKTLAPYEGQANVFESVFSALKNLIATGSDKGAFANVFDPVEANLTQLANMLRSQFGGALLDLSNQTNGALSLPTSTPVPASSPAPTTPPKACPQQTVTNNNTFNMTVSVKDVEEMIRLSKFVDDLPRAVSLVFGAGGGA